MTRTTQPVSVICSCMVSMLKSFIFQFTQSWMESWTLSCTTIYCWANFILFVYYNLTNQYVGACVWFLSNVKKRKKSYSFDRFINFISYRKQLSEYLPSTVLKQKKRNSTVPSEVCSTDLTPVALSYNTHISITLLGIVTYFVAVLPGEFNSLNIVHEKSSPFWLVKSSAVFF